MQFPRLSGLFVLSLLAVNPAWAVPTYTIEDNYIGAGSTSNSYDWYDRIGGERYEVQGMDVSVDSGYLNVRIYTNFTPDSYGTTYGDLFISTDGWNPYGSAPYRGDNASNGEDWEFVFDTSKNALYGGDFTITQAQNAEPAIHGGYIVRDGQEVLRNDGGVKIYDTSKVDLSHAGYSGYIDYSILLASLNFDKDTDIGLKWGMTCANDTIEGAYHVSVPAPAPLALLSLGLVMLGLRRLS